MSLPLLGRWVDCGAPAVEVYLGDELCQNCKQLVESTQGKPELPGGLEIRAPILTANEVVQLASKNPKSCS